MKHLLTALCILALAIPAFAAEWAEVDDAPQLPPGQDTYGTGGLDLITGYLELDGADMYCIYVEDPAVFTATTCGSVFDTQLFLFDEMGYGVSYNDDDPGGCGLQSTVTGAFMTGPGYYLLAVSCYDFDPISGGLAIWADTPYGEERAPDGDNPGGMVDGWEGSHFYQDVYSVILTGADFCTGDTATDSSNWSTLKALY